MATSKDYVVGAKLPPSGVFRRSAEGKWQQLGYNHPFTFSIDYDAANPRALFLAAGNGLISLTTEGRNWTHLTGSDLTELRDVHVKQGIIYFAHTAGVRVSRDRGATWTEIGKGLARKYTEVVRADLRGPALLAGTESGIYRTEDGGTTWRLSGASGFQLMDLEQSPHDPCFWMAATERGGVFVSTDCGKTFENPGNIAVNRNVYDVAFDPATPGRVAIGGWGLGVAVSDNNGKKWEIRNATLPSTDVWSVGFDPGKAGRLFASVHEEAVFISEDAGRIWRRDGLEGSIVYRMKFAPEVASR